MKRESKRKGFPRRHRQSGRGPTSLQRAHIHIRACLRILHETNLAHSRFVCHLAEWKRGKGGERNPGLIEGTQEVLVVLWRYKQIGKYDFINYIFRILKKEAIFESCWTAPSRARLPLF